MMNGIEGVMDKPDEDIKGEEEQWIPRPLNLQPRKPVRLFDRVDEDDSDTEPLGRSGVETGWLATGTDNSDTVEISAVDPKPERDPEPDDLTGGPDRDKGKNNAKQDSATNNGLAVEAKPADDGSGGGEDGSGDKPEVIEGTVVPADSTALVSLGSASDLQRRRKTALWMRIGAVAIAVLIVGIVTFLGVRPGLMPSKNPVSLGASSGSWTGDVSSTGSSSSPADEGTTEEPVPTEEPPVVIPDNLRKKTPSATATSESSTTAVDPGVSQPTEGVAPPAPPPTSKQTVVTSGQVVLSQYMERGSIYWMYTVSGLPAGAVVQVSSSSGQVDNRSRPPTSTLAVRTKVPAGNERVVWTVTVSARNGSPLFEEVLTTE